MSQDTAFRYCDHYSLIRENKRIVGKSAWEGKGFAEKHVFAYGGEVTIFYG